MMTKSGGGQRQEKNGKTSPIPCLDVTRLGIVSRDYRVKFANGYRDFSHALPGVLKLLDEKGCDAVLFSLYSIIPRKSYNPRAAFNALRNIKAVLLEYQDRERERPRPKTYVVHHRTSGKWLEYELFQQFATLRGMAKEKIDDFISNELPKRILGNCCVLLCGESNGVKYSRKDKKVKDSFGVRAAIPQSTNIVLNPIHDRMTRFEMKLKREYLSANGRWVVSVWNKGKKDKNGKVKDGRNPAWTVFHNGKEKDVELGPVHTSAVHRR